MKSKYPIFIVPKSYAKRLRKLGFKGEHYFQLDDDPELLPTFDEVFEWFRSKGLYASQSYYNSKEGGFYTLMKKIDVDMTLEDSLTERDKYIFWKSEVTGSYRKFRLDILNKLLNYLEYGKACRY